jgi:hypothetical protein
VGDEFDRLADGLSSAAGIAWLNVQGWSSRPPPTRRGFDNTRGDSKQGGLPGSVGPGDMTDRSSPEVQVDRRQRKRLAERS